MEMINVLRKLVETWVLRLCTPFICPGMWRMGHGGGGGYQNVTPAYQRYKGASCNPQLTFSQFYHCLAEITGKIQIDMRIIHY